MSNSRNETGKAMEQRPPEVVLAVEAALERNAREPLLMDLRGLSDATDWFLIASGDSDTHSRAIADNILERLRASGYRPAGVEGKSAATWILLDYITLVVHVFLPRVRDYYELERLWGDAPALAVE
ncbi:MAG: ribosome silencing factor [marine benthic group bacterium]|nr:ribosome silencing factor [Candidatus Benthicola marisminoris]